MKPNLKKKKQSLDPFQAEHSYNFLKDWIASGKERRRREEAEAAKKIANETAYNEKAIADTLLGVSFLRSRLPQEILTQRTPRKDQNDMDPCCDLEHDARELAREMMDQQQTMQVDLRSIDQQLLVLAQRFQEAVEKGYATTAFAALDGMIRGIHEIRARVPQNDLKFCNQYIEVNTNYLKEWVHLCDQVKEMDLMRENVKKRQASYDSEKEEADKRKDAFWKKMEQDGHKGDIFLKIYQYKKPEDRLSWSNEVMEVYENLVEMRFKDADLDLQNCLLRQEQSRLSNQEGQVEFLRGKLLGLPIVQDPNQLNELQDAMDGMIREMAQIDTELSETFSVMGKIEAQLLQMQSAQGNLRMMETASMQAQKMVEERREKEQQLQNAGNGENLREKLGLKSEEQLQAIKNQQEQDNQKEQDNTQGQPNFN